MTEPTLDVLVLDDEETIQFVLDHTVKSVGGQAWPAATVAEATRLIAQRPFACALLDKNLPDGSGIAVLQRLSEAQPRCASIVMTAWGNIDSAVQALRLGASDYLLKPFEPEVLAHRLKQVFERQRMLADHERMRAQLMQSDRLATLGTLAASVVHELNNPLSYVLSNVEFLEEAIQRLRCCAKDAEKVASSLAIYGQTLAEIRQGAERMLRVARDVRTFVQSKDETFEPVQVVAVVEAALQAASSQLRNRARVVTELAPVPPVLASEAKLAQVFFNLIVNAGQAIPEERRASGTVTVRTRAGAAREAVIEVLDNGVGIPPPVRARLFEPFFTTRRVGEGTGMGLTIAKTLIEAFGGRIEVESEPGRGACFRVVLPVTDVPSQRVEPGEAIEPGEGRRGKVLIIDSEPSVGAALQRVLELEHDVSTVADGPSALALLRQGKMFDAVLCDLMMPGFGGIDLHLEAERISPEQARRFLFMGSAAFAEDARERVGQLGRPLLEKPIQANTLRRAIRECVE